MVKASSEGAGLEFDVMRRLLMVTIDVLVHTRAHDGRRSINGIDFDPWRGAAAGSAPGSGSGRSLPGEPLAW